ncbi:hypothetical protein [Providencia vermicola]|uniref:hypothetical protein n=1 Tax=Providencia vermicola TaxID=333965 RepID=UPI0034D75199
MEKLQQLASTIAQIYVDGLKAETGTTLVTYNGITGEVIPELLAAGLFDNAVYIVKTDGEQIDVEGKAFNLLSPLINLSTKPYTLTERAYNVINFLNTKALKARNILSNKTNCN